MCIETNVGSTIRLKDVRHVPDLRMNVFLHWLCIELVIVTTLVMKDGNLLRGHWLLREDMHVAICT